MFVANVLVLKFLLNLCLSGFGFYCLYWF